MSEAIPTTCPAVASDGAPTPAGIVEGLGPDERRVLFGVLVAQHYDVHAVAWSFSEADYAVAERLVDSLEDTPGPAARASLLSLAVSVFDLDHPLLHESEVAACAELLATLELEFGEVYPSTPAAAAS